MEEAYQLLFGEMPMSELFAMRESPEWRLLRGTPGRFDALLSIADLDAYRPRANTPCPMGA
ncbi:MAG: hypothetical protein NTW56_12495 [Alphaproteobacteria bacterium]|nr:hypothetical protein [Alphaproteobacteria bacterium]